VYLQVALGNHFGAHADEFTAFRSAPQSASPFESKTVGIAG
jgi:hypothetical protein